MTRSAVLTTHRHLFLLLMGLGLFARVLVPAGWMPHVSNGDVRLVLCAGFGSVSAQAPVAGHDKQQATETHAEHGQSTPPSGDQPTTMGAPCPFTLAAAPALLLAGAANVMPLLPVAIEARWTPVAITRTARLAAPPPPAIGPPTT